MNLCTNCNEDVIDALAEATALTLFLELELNVVGTDIEGPVLPATLRSNIGRIHQNTNEPSELFKAMIRNRPNILSVIKSHNKIFLQKFTRPQRPICSA